MDDKDPCLIENPHGVGIFKIIYLFLQNQNFPKTAETFREEWGLDKADIEQVSSQSVLLTKCKCSKNQANQTDLKRMNAKHRHDWLEGSFQSENFQLKEDDTHIFYVCNHCHKKHKNKLERTQRIETMHIEKSPEARSPRYEAKKLKSKFSQLQDEHQKLIAVTTELTNALQMNIIGQTKNIYAVLDQCKTIYPSLFDSNCPRVQILESGDNPGEFPEVQLETLHPKQSTESLSANNTNHERSSQVRDSSPPQQTHFESLNLEELSPISPLATTPLTPETVRCILEMVFEKIFDLEKSRGSEHDTKSPPLNKEDVERIVGEVFNETMRSPLNCGAGEGEYSRPESISRSRNQNNSLHIDYAKLKSDLIHGDNERKIRILQALRWRITKNDGPTREKVLESYATHDVLDLFENISIPERFLLGYGMDHYVQESTCRLINALASLRQGRDYLTMDERLLKRVLIKKVKDVRTVSGAVIRNMLVASVQKLSIRKQCRNQMVNEGLFEIMIDYLDEFYENLSKYCLEYCSALLMNLCLVEDAKYRATKNPRKVIGLLGKFLQSENECCLPYINGVMFSLFEKLDMVNEAKTQNLDKVIIKFSQTTSNHNLKKQLDFILQSRIFGRTDQNIHEDEEDSKDEVDLLEAELDQDDYITQLPSGEKLLEEYKPDMGLNTTVLEKPTNSVSFSVVRKDPPNSAKSFSEEIKQHVHKPSSERGIFETFKAKRYSIWSQNLKTNYVGKKAPNQSCGRYPATPLCYMENCQKMQSGAECSCSKCSPGQSKYACGCYEAIRKDVAETGEDLDNFPSRRKVNSKNGQPKSHQVAKASGELPDDIDKSDSTVQAVDMTANNEESTINNKGGRTTSGCKVCGEKKCECAFDSRPKLCRTPTL